MSPYLSTGDICEIAALAPKTFDEWVVRGVLQPLSGGTGKGIHRRFSLMQAVAITFGVRLRRLNGATLSSLAAIANELGTFSEAELARSFEKGRKYLRPGVPVKLTAA